MKGRVLSSLAKFTISVISIVAISSCVLTIIAKITEKRVKHVREYAYSSKPLGYKYSTLLEGGFWQLTEVEDTLQNEAINVAISDVVKVLDLLDDHGASYAYSYADNKLASFWPMADARRVLSGWELPWYENYLLLEVVIPRLQKDNMKSSTGHYTDSYAEFCSVMGSPLPALAMTGYKDFFFNNEVPIGETEPTGFPSISYGLNIEELSQNELVLAKGNHKFHYKRVKNLPLKIAPISVYFQKTAYNCR